MNPLKSKFFKTVATIKQGEVIEFDITGSGPTLARSV